MRVEYHRATRYLPETPRSQFVASLLVYAGVTAVIGRGVLANLSSAVANDAGDPLLNAAILHWNAHHLPFTEAWWQFPIFYPVGDTLTFSEHLLGLSAITAPIDWLIGDPLATYNIATLLTFILSAAAMYLLVYRLSGSAAGAFIAGLAYGFAPYRISQLPHIQVLAGFWAPLALLGLHAYLDSGRRRWLGLFALSWALQSAANGYALVFFSVLIAFWILWFVVLERRWTALAMIAVAGIAGTVPLAPLLMRYVTVHAVHGFTRGVEEIQSFSADVAGVLCTPPGLTFWGWLRVGCRAEGELFPGPVLMLLVLAAVFGAAQAIWRVPSGGTRRWQRWVRGVLGAVAAIYGMVVLSVIVFGPWRFSWLFISASASSIAKPTSVMAVALVGFLWLSPGLREVARRWTTVGFYLMAALATWLLALGPAIALLGEPTGRSGPYAWLMLLPGADGLRVPARFWMITVICLAVVAGLTVARLLAGRSRRVVVAALAVLTPALITDSWVDRIQAPPAPLAAPDPRALEGQVAIELPIGGYLDLAAQWRAVQGGWRVVNGYSGYGPAHYPSLVSAIEGADAAGLRPFQREHELHVIVQTAYPRLVAMIEAQPGVAFVASNEWARQYRLPKIGGGAELVGARIPIATVASDCLRTEDPPRAVLDGDETTRWVCPPNVLQELTVDVGAPTTVGAFVQHLGEYYWEAPQTMIIETSVDGVTWMPAHNGSVVEYAIEGAIRTPLAATVQVPFAPREARYLKVRVENQIPNFHFTMAEAEVRAPR